MAYPIAVVERGLQATLSRALSNFQAQRDVNPGLVSLATRVVSTGADEKYGWIGAMPQVSEWLGELNAEQLKSYDYTIKNKDFAAPLMINENDIADDRVGVLTMLTESLAQRIVQHPRQLIIDLIINGDATAAYDGVNYFSNVSGVRTIDNLLAGTGTSLAQIEADLEAALVAMASFKDDRGEVLNIMGDTIVCPKALENDFRRLVFSQADPTATAGTNTFNPYAGRFQVIGDARLDADDANDWYLFSTQEIVKPFIWQERQTAMPMMEKKANTKTWIFSANYRGNAGYGLPHLAVKTVNS